jgi:hypothetical protein
MTVSSLFVSAGIEGSAADVQLMVVIANIAINDNPKLES